MTMNKNERMALPEKYAPLLAALRDLGAIMGTCDSRLLRIRAPANSRHLCLSFGSHDEAVAFIGRLVDHVERAPAIARLMVGLGAVVAMKCEPPGDGVVVFWPELHGDVASLH